MGTGIGTKFAPTYANCSVGFLEKIFLFPIEPPKYFSQYKLIEELFKNSGNICMTVFSHGILHWI